MAREHLSIGEVLTLLQSDFSDVTISKIRFLETQGLIDPERTPSGYRKFYEPDITKLRWVLTQQRDNFLPLRVIRERIAAGDHLQPEPQPELEPSTGLDVGSHPTLTLGTASSPPLPEPDHHNSDGSGEGSLLDGGPTSVTLTMDELAGATGLAPSALAELERYGFFASRQLGPSTYYDGEALAVAHIAAKFLKFGVEPRHLRMYKHSAEREASIFEQVVMPLIRQRNPTARRAALDRLEELNSMGSQLRAAMMRQALADHLDR